MISVVGFIACASLITFSGTQLSKQGDRLAELTGLSRAWIGLILMATVTSLPELVTGVSSVVIVKSPDLAMGNVLGSCAFNLLILSLLDLMVKKPITSLVKNSHVLAGAFSILLLSIVAGAIFLAADTPQIFGFSPVSLLLVVVYVLAMRIIFVHDKDNALDRDEPTCIEAKDSLKKVISVYAVHALIVTSAALFLPYFGQRIADQFGMSDSFFGTIFLAITTSLPELVISISAIRIGALDMAIANLLGSNVFNVAILSVIDLFYASPLFQSMSPGHILSILGSIIMTSVVAIGLMVRPQSKRWLLSVDSWIIVLIYALILLILD